MAMTKEERAEYKKDWEERLKRLAAENPEFGAKLNRYRIRLDKKYPNGKKNKNAFESTEEADDYLEEIMETDPYWTGMSSDERGRLLQQADPTREADFNDGVSTARGNLERNAQILGFTIAPEQLDSLATQAYREAWDDNDMRIHLRPLADAALGASDDNSGFTGNLGNAAAELSDWAALNGIAIDQTSADQMLASIAFEDKTMDQVKQELRNTYMIGAYPAWADQIRAGIDISTLASPYRDVAQRMLGRANIQMNDPIMQQLMQVQGPDGQFAARPLWEAEKYIRGLDEWQYTDDAAETYASATKAVGAMFGFG